MGPLYSNVGVADDAHGPRGVYAQHPVVERRRLIDAAKSADDTAVGLDAGDEEVVGARAEFDLANARPSVRIVGRVSPPPQLVARMDPQGRGVVSAANRTRGDCTRDDVPEGS
jgi:hypothetical protein